MYCARCGSNSRQNAKFCEHCGSTFLTSKPDSKKPGKISKNSSKKKWVVVLIAFAVIGTVFFQSFSSGNSLTGYSQDETGFKKAISKQYSLVEEGQDNSIREIYNNFLDPKIKTVSEEEYIRSWHETSEGTFQKMQIHSYKVAGNTAYVDRTALICRDTECSNVLSRSRNFRKYNYSSGRWLMTDDVYYCPRDKQYEMPPEFSRAISLILQRSVPDELKDSYQEIMKCVEIQYARSDYEINQAEGVFKFIPGQSVEKLSIYVSPRYQYKDDLMTAALLSHELTHVVNYVVGLMSYKPIDCFEDEARAFQQQNWFLFSLNAEEKQSIISRAQSGASPELRGLVNAFTDIPKMKGSTYEEKALNYVKSSPFYQKQCL